MLRYPLAAALALAAFATAGSAGARDLRATGAPAPVAPACPVPAGATGPVLPPSTEGDLENQIDQLTGVIAALSDRLASLEDVLGEDDEDSSDEGDSDFDLAHAPGTAHPGLHQRLSKARGLARPHTSSTAAEAYPATPPSAGRTPVA